MTSIRLVSVRLEVGVPLADGLDILLGELGTAEQPHLAAVGDELGHARRRNGEHGAGEEAGGAVVADRGGKRRDEEVPQPVVAGAVGDTEIKVTQVGHETSLSAVPTLTPKTSTSGPLSRNA